MISPGIDNLDPVIRNTVRAVIVRDRALLLLRKEGPYGERFALPGGGQDAGETLIEALQRECVEEIATPVEVAGLMHVADFFKARDTLPPSTRHLVEFLFRCRVADDYRPTNGHHPDRHQVEVIWMPLPELTRRPLFPPYLSSVLGQVGDPVPDLYLGKR